MAVELDSAIDNEAEIILEHSRQRMDVYGGVMKHFYALIYIASQYLEFGAFACIVSYCNGCRLRILIQNLYTLECELRDYHLSFATVTPFDVESVVAGTSPVSRRFLSFSASS